jgi:hypothetical protein
MNTPMNFVRIAALCGAVFLSMPAFARTQTTGPFAGLSGHWSGSGQVNRKNGTDERIRCRAEYAVAAEGHEMTMRLACTSDDYKVDAYGRIRYENERLSGMWQERINDVQGAVTGSVRGNRMHVTLEAKGFYFDLTVVTRGRYQQVRIVPENSFVSNIYIEMHKH